MSVDIAVISLGGASSQGTLVWSSHDSTETAVVDSTHATNFKIAALSRSFTYETCLCRLSITYCSKTAPPIENFLTYLTCLL